MAAIRIDTGFNLTGLQRGWAFIDKSIKSIAGSIGNIGNSISQAFDSARVDKTTQSIEQLNQQSRYTDNNLKIVKKDLIGVGSAEKGVKNVSSGFVGLSTSVGKTLSRIKSLLITVLIFNVIRKSITEFRDYIGLALKENQTFANSFAQVKGNLLVAFQPIIDIIVPMLTTFMEWLARATQYVATFVNLLFGKSVKASTASAKALNKQSQALKGVNKQAKNASNSLDELAMVSKEGADAGTTTIAPQFAEIPQSVIDDTTSFYNRLVELWPLIKEIGIAIAIAFASWKILEFIGSFVNLLPILDKIGGIALIIGGAFLFFSGLSDIINNNDLSFQNLAETLGGIVLIVTGIAILFGGIPALITGIILIIGTLTAIIIKNWDNIKEGINQIGRLFSSIFGEGILKALGSMFDSFKRILGGIKDFIVGIFTGDIGRAISGLGNIFGGLINAILSYFELGLNFILAPINALIKGFNATLGKIPGVSDIPQLQVSIPKIPRLATGDVVSPGKEFMAILGDNKTEKEVVSPLSTIEQAVDNVLSRRGGTNTSEEEMALMREQNQLLSAILQRTGIVLDGRQLMASTENAQNNRGIQTGGEAFRNVY